MSDGARAPVSPGVLLAVVFAGAVGGALLGGRQALAVVVLAICAVLLIDLQGALRRSGAPAILPASALVGFGAPLAVALQVENVATGLLVAGAFCAAILVALAGRRRQISKSLGATLLAGLLPGLGGSAVILLGDAQPAALMVLVFALLMGEGAMAAMRRTRGRAAQAEALAVLAAVALAGGLSSPFTALPLGALVGVSGIAFLGVLGGASLRGALSRPDRPLPGSVTAATASVAMAAPVVLFLVG